MKLLLNLLIMVLLSTCTLVKRPSGDANPVVKSEFIFHTEDVTFPSCHASTIAETEHGLVAAWFAGTSEKNPDVGIRVSRFMNGKWTTPQETANGLWTIR